MSEIEPGLGPDRPLVALRLALEDLTQKDITMKIIAAMDAAGIDVSILSVVAPVTPALPAADALPLARDANDEAPGAVRARPGGAPAAPGGRVDDPAAPRPACKHSQ